MSLTKDEIIAMAREAGGSQLMRLEGEYVDNFQLTGNRQIERFTTLCRAPLVAELERLTFTLNQEALARENVSALRAQLADEVDSLKAERDDWKARALKAEQAEVRLWDSQWVNVVNHDNCYAGWSKEDAINHAVKMTEQLIASNVDQNKLPSVATPPSAVPVVEQLVGALEGVVVGADESWTQACKELNSMGITSVPVSNASAGLINRQIEAIGVARTAIAAGQQFIKENGK